MKIFKSIKWRLQLWYGMILVAVLAGFGFTAFQLECGRVFRRVDDELNRRFGILARTLHAPPRGGQPGAPRFDRPPPPDQFPGDGPPRQDIRQPREFHLPPEQTALFGTNTPNNFYFIINDRNDKEIARSSNVPDSEAAFQHRFDTPRARHGFDDGVPHPFASVSFKENRAFFQRLPSGETILAGCSVAPELRELKRTTWKLTGVGTVILFFGLAGGWWIAGRAIRPIHDIGAAAVKISAGDLSQRISTSETESELGQLAGVLNSTFARLEAAFAQQKQFASDAAHELRTPVSVMLTQTQLALNRERSAAEYRETLEACRRASQRMRRLIESLLELARLDAGQQQMNRAPFDLSQTVRDCAESLRPLADERKVKIDCELVPLEIVGDSERIGQVVTNLLTNAIQYNVAGGEVRLAAKLQNGVALLAVADTGQGIPTEDLPRIFKRFYRADKSRAGGNAGLGLAISKAIIEAHGGAIDVSSEPGSGAVFTVRLPA